MAVIIPDNRLRFPIQRFFSGSPYVQRFDQLAALERRLRELELAYGLKSFQYGEDEVTATATFTLYSQVHPSIGGPSVTVHVPGPDALVMLYAEYDIRITSDIGPTSHAHTFIYESSRLPAGVQVARHQSLPTNVWHNDLTLTKAQYVGTPAMSTRPRGSRQVLSHFPQGDYTFELRHGHSKATGSAVETAEVRNRFLSVEVL